MLETLSEVLWPVSHGYYQESAVYEVVLFVIESPVALYIVDHERTICWYVAWLDRSC